MVVFAPLLILLTLSEKTFAQVFWMARNIWAAPILYGMGCIPHIRYEERLERHRSYMLVANHTSMLDIMLMLRVSRNPFVFVGKKELARQISTFDTIGKAREESDDQFAGLDEAKMEHAFTSLMREAEHINEDDPRQMASLMRKFTSQTGVHLGDSMEEAISRMEAGEDPEQVEKEMGELLSDEDFSLESMKKKVLRQSSKPVHDEKLYEL